MKPRIVLIGPNPTKGLIGGLVTHMRVITSLNIFKDAIIHDLGSIQKTSICEIFVVLFNSLSIGNKVPIGAKVIINSSIYPTAFIKLLIILTSLRCCGETDVYVFFHGGRLKNLRFLRNVTIRKITKRILKGAKEFYFLNKSEVRAFQNLFPDIKCSLFRNYLQFDNTIPRRESAEKKLLFVGRLVKEKGIFDIIHALLGLANTGKLENARMIFVGEGPDSTRLKILAKNLGLDSVDIIGSVPRERIFDIYSRGYVLILPSYKEAFPYVILEAMRAGLPIIATPTGAIPDIIENERNGLIVTHKNPNELAQAILRLLEDETLWARISNNNYEKYKNMFSMIAAEEFYQKLLRGSS